MDEAIVLMTKTQFKRACTVCRKIGHEGLDSFNSEKNKGKKDAYMKEQNERRNKGKYRNGQRKGNNQNREGNYNNREGNMAMAGINNDMILIANNVTQKINKRK